MRNFECSTCGGDKYYIKKLRGFIDTASIKQALKEIDNFNQDQIIQLHETDGLSNSHLALMLSLFSDKDLKSIFNAWMSMACQTDAIITLIDEGQLKRWDYSEEAIVQLLKKNKDEICANNKLKRCTRL